ENQVATYKVEPYVVAADVYAVAPHTGRGGWTWYTGSAGWMYRLLVESLLGLSLEVGRLRISPLMPKEWTRFSIRYRYRATVYRIDVSKAGEGEGGGETRITIDGAVAPDGTVALIDDGREHVVSVTLVLRAEPALVPAS